MHDHECAGGCFDDVALWDSAKEPSSFFPNVWNTVPTIPRKGRGAKGHVRKTVVHPEPPTRPGTS